MKTKFLLCLALVLSGGFATQRACGYVAEIQINHSNFKTYCSFLKIETIHLNSTNNPVVFGVEETSGWLDGAPVDYIINLKEFADEK